MVATVVTHMMIALNNHISRTPNTNSNYKKVVTITEFEKITEVKYKSAIEQSQLPQAGPQLFQYNLNEPAKSVGDGLARQALKVRALSDTKSISSTITQKPTHLLTETKTISDGLVRVKKGIRSLSEPAKSVSESLSRQIKKVYTVSEPANTIGESLAESTKFPRTLATQTTTISDSVVKVARKIKTIAETQITITEAISHLRVAGLTQSPISISEALAAARIFTKVLEEDTFVAGRSLQRSFRSTSFTTNSFEFSSLETLTHGGFYNLSQTTTIAENLFGARNVPRLLNENVPLSDEQLQRLVNHILVENTSISDALDRLRRPTRAISETTTISDALTPARLFQRIFNPISFTDIFTTDSFNTPSQDNVIVIEELEGLALGQGVRNLLEPSTDISESLVLNVIPFNKILPETVIVAESLDALKIPVPVVSTPTRVGSRRRMRRYRTFLRSLQPIKTPKVEPEHEPLAFEVELSDSPTMIQESLTAVKIVSEKEIVSVAAATPPPQIIEKEIEKIVYVDRIVEKEVLVEPPPIIQAEPILISKPRPIETNQEILVSTQSHSNRMKSRAASAKLHLLEKLKMLTEMEELI